MNRQRIALGAGTVWALALSLSACGTDYHEMGWFGGVEAVKIDETTLRISARGNSFTDISTMKDYVLLRAAEETLKNGYDSFEIDNADNVTRTKVYSVPESHTVTVHSFGGGWTQATVWGSSTQSSTIPGEDITIKMLKGLTPADAPPGLFAAREVIANLGPRILPENSEVLALAAMPPANAAHAAPNQPVSLSDSACAKRDAELAKFASAKGYQYQPNCRP